MDLSFFVLSHCTKLINFQFKYIKFKYIIIYHFTFFISIKQIKSILRFISYNSLSLSQSVISEIVNLSCLV